MRESQARGQVLVQVLVMSLLLAILATALIKSVVHQSYMAKKNLDSTEKTAFANSVVMTVVSAWNLNGGRLCSNGPRVFGCPDTDVCDCSCNVDIGGAGYPFTASAININGSNYCQISYTATY